MSDENLCDHVGTIFPHERDNLIDVMSNKPGKIVRVAIYKPGSGMMAINMTASEALDHAIHIMQAVGNIS